MAADHFRTRHVSTISLTAQKHNRKEMTTIMMSIMISKSLDQ